MSEILILWWVPRILMYTKTILFLVIVIWSLLWRSLDNFLPLFFLKLYFSSFTTYSYLKCLLQKVFFASECTAPLTGLVFFLPLRRKGKQPEKQRKFIILCLFTTPSSLLTQEHINLMVVSHLFICWAWPIAWHRKDAHQAIFKDGQVGEC